MLKSGMRGSNLQMSTRTIGLNRPRSNTSPWIDGSEGLAHDLIELDRNNPGWDEEFHVIGALRRLHAGNYSPKSVQDTRSLFNDAIVEKALQSSFENGPLP